MMIKLHFYLDKDPEHPRPAKPFWISKDSILEIYEVNQGSMVLSFQNKTGRHVEESCQEILDLLK